MSNYVEFPTRFARIFPPLPEGHPVLDEKCAGCKQQFQAGDLTLIVQVGPGDDPEARAKARAGLEYNAVGVLAHLQCVTGGGTDE